MSLARQIDRLFRRQLSVHVAWVPIVTRYSLGDYGLCRGGVFEPVGNVRDFGIEVEAVEGRTARLDFVSNTSSMIRKVGSTTVDVFPETDAEAELHVDFGRRHSLLLRCPELRSSRVANVAVIGQQLASARRSDGLPWRSRYRMVSELFTGEDVTMLSTDDIDGKVVLRGQARALQRFEGTGSSVGLEIQAKRSLGLDLMGARGSVGLDLVRFSRRDGRVFTTRGAGEAGGLEVEPAGWVEREDEPGDDL